MIRVVTLLVIAVPGVQAFVPLTSVPHKSALAPYRATKNSNDDEEDDAFKYYNRQDIEKVVTQEMLWRDLLEDPKVKKRKRNGSYKPLDNRDSLPFVIVETTPDPYTPKQKKKEDARRNMAQNRMKKKKTDLMGGIAASIYSQQADGSLEKVLGEFSLDKHTNCGDLLEVGNKEYEVQKARCQYKYAGGKRFVMVRKILEVKEVVRVAEENYLLRQFRKGETLSDDPPSLE